MKKIVWLIGTFISMNVAVGSDLNVTETPDFYWTPKKVDELDKITSSFEINQHKMITGNEAELWEEWNELVVGLKPKHQEKLFKILKEKMSEEGCVNLQMTVKRISDMQLTPDHSIPNMNHVDEQKSATSLFSGQIKYETHVTGTWVDKGKWRWIKYQGELEENGKIIFNNNTEHPRIYSRGRKDNPQIIFLGLGGAHDERELLEPSLCSRFCNACSSLIQRIGECLSPQRSANSARGEPSYENLP